MLNGLCASDKIHVPRTTVGTLESYSLVYLCISRLYANLPYSHNILRYCLCLDRKCDSGIVEGGKKSRGHQVCKVCNTNVCWLINR